MNRNAVRAWTVLPAIALLLALSTTAHAATLLGHWKQEETNTAQPAIDSSSTNPAGTYAAGVGADVSGPAGFGNASQFFGNGNNINIGAGATLSLTSNFSVTGWAKFDNLASKHSFLGNPSWAVRNDGTAPQITTFGVKDYTGTAGTLTANRWHHIAVVLDSAFDATFYVDGVLAGTSLHNAPANFNNTAFAIGGRDPGNAFESMLGRVDDVRFFSGTLTQAEVQAIMVDYTAAVLPQVIMPTSVTVNAGSQFFPAANLINGSGLSGAGTYNTIGTITHAASDAGNAWVTDAFFPNYYAGGGPVPQMDFDLGGEFDLTDLVAWNYSVLGNAARQVTLTFSTDDGLTFANPVVLEIPQAAGPAHVLALGGTFRADTVRVTFNSNWVGFGAGGDRVGLGELKFLGALVPLPEPGSLALISLAGAALLGRKRRAA